jgi:hypothetical protein
LFFKILLVYEYLRYAQWDNDDYDVLADGVVVGRIMETAAAPVGQPWIWMLAFGHHEDRTPTHGYAETREAAMEAFAKSIAPSRRGWQISARRCEDRIERRRATGAAIVAIQRSPDAADRQRAVARATTRRRAYGPRRGRRIGGNASDTSQGGRRALHCGIAIRPMSGFGTPRLGQLFVLRRAPPVSETWQFSVKLQLAATAILLIGLRSSS